MRTIATLTQTDIDNVKWSAGRDIRFGVLCLIVTLLCTAALVVIGMAEGQELISWHYLFAVAWTAAGTAWALTAFGTWVRHRKDLRERQKDIWTTTSVERRTLDKKTPGRQGFKRYELIVDGETFVILHHRLDELGFHRMGAGRATTVEVSRHGRMLLAVRQPAA